MRESRVIALVLLSSILLTGGCGYHFAGDGTPPRADLGSVAIPLFENGTSEPELETIFATALRKEFMLRSRIPVVPLEEAEAVFQGKVISATTASVAHRFFEDTIETRIYVVLDIRCVDPSTSEVLWQSKGLSFFEEYYQSSDPIVSFDNRRRALDTIAGEIAARVYDRFTSNF